MSTKYMIKDDSRPTTVKTRISGKCSQSVTQQVVRIDRQSCEKLSPEIEKKVLDPKNTLYIEQFVLNLNCKL